MIVVYERKCRLSNIVSRLSSPVVQQKYLFLSYQTCWLSHFLLCFVLYIFFLTDHSITARWTWVLNLHGIKSPHKRFYMYSSMVLSHTKVIPCKGFNFDHSTFVDNPWRVWNGGYCVECFVDLWLFFIPLWNDMAMGHIMYCPPFR